MTLRKHRLAGSIVGLALVAAGCADSSPVADIAVRIEVTPPADTLFVGEVSSRLSARALNALDDEIPDAPIRWKSDQPFIVAVDSLTGVLTGLQAGLAAVTARTGSVADTAEVRVVNVLQVRLPLDTLILAPGDTFTVPVTIQTFDGSTPPAPVFSGGVPGVASIDASTGLVTALGAGTAAFGVQVDTVSAAGFVAVITMTDVQDGLLHVSVSGAATANTTFGSAAYNHPTDDGRSVFQLAVTPAGFQELYAVLIDSLTAPGTRVVETLLAEDTGSDPVCRPPASWVLYRRTDEGFSAFSLAGGYITVTSDVPITGARAISGRMDVQVQRPDVSGTAGIIRIQGTFVVPLISLAACPK